MLPKSTTPAHMADNIDIFDFALTDADMDAMRALDTGKGAHDPEEPGRGEWLLQHFKVHD